MAKSLVHLLAERASGKPKASPKKQRSAASSSSSCSKAPDANATSKERLFAIYGKPQVKFVKKTMKKTLKRPAAAGRRPGKNQEDKAANAKGKSCEDVQLM